MNIGQRLKRAMLRNGLTRKDIAVRTGMDKATVTDVLNGTTKNPRHETVERIRSAIGVTYSELYDEPHLRLSHSDSDLAHSFHAFLGRLLTHDAAQKELTGEPQRPPYDRADEVRESYSDGPHEVEELLNEPIPEPYVRLGAGRAFRVATDTMIGAGIMEGAVIFVRKTVDVAAADGRIVVCLLNRRRYVKRLDLRGNGKVLRNENPRYDPLRVADDDRFTLIGIVITDA